MIDIELDMTKSIGKTVPKLSTSLLLLTHLLPFILSARPPCPELRCTNSSDETALVIRFPFTTSSRVSSSCWYPGFKLLCPASSGNPILELSPSLNLTVKQISYSDQQMDLYDPSNCLAGKLLDLDLSSTPFILNTVRSFTLYNCSSAVANKYFYYDKISCLSGSGSTVLSTTVVYSGAVLAGECEELGEVWVSDTSSASLSAVESVTLAWAQPDCVPCESNGGECVRRDDQTLQVDCFRRRGLSGGHLAALISGLVVPAVVVMALIIIIMRRSADQSRPGTAQVMATQNNPSQQGLDQIAIESYPVVVVGESGRLTNPDDKTCPICLTDYQPKERLKVIPECSHRFHNDCLNEWLSTKATCPLCRIQLSTQNCPPL